MCVAVVLPRPASAQGPLSIELRRDLTLGESDGVTFGGLLRLAVNSTGIIYVGDWASTHVLAFAPDGAVLDTIGRRGNGPAEFTAVHSVYAGRGDSVFVYDANLARLSVFVGPSNDHRIAYSLRPQFGDVGRPYRVLIPNDSRVGYLAAVRRPASGSLTVHRMDRAGAIESKPLITGSTAASQVSVRESAGSTEVLRTSPLFGRSAVLGLTPADEIYYGWTETIDLTFYEISGKQLGIFRADAPSIPVTDRDIELALADATEVRRRLLADAEHPATKPAVHTVIIDDESRIWTGRYTRDPERHEWWVTLEQGRGESAIFSLPSDVDIQVVRGGRAYAVSVDELGAPTVLRFVVNIRPAE